MTPRNFVTRFGIIVLSIALSLVLTALLIGLLDNDPIRVFETTWDGAFSDNRRLGSVFNYFIPLTLATTGLVVTFTAGLWNIGVEGQIVMGAVFASWGAQFLDLPAFLLIPTSIILGAIGGALWAMVAGILKLRFGVHEIFGGVALNSIANLIAIHLIAGPWEPPEGGSAQSTPPFPEASWLPVLSPDFPVSLLMLVITVVAVLVVLFLLYGTRWGLTLKAIGKNSRSALLLGIPTDRVALSAFAVCGLLAGIAGSHRVLHTYHSLRPLVSGGIGFLGLLVALLVAYNLILVPIVTFALAAMSVGSARVKILMQLDQSLVGVIQGLVVLMILLVNGVRDRFSGSNDDPPPPPEPGKPAANTTLEATSNE